MYSEIQRFTDLDRNVLEEENAYGKYFLYLQHVFGKVLQTDIGVPWGKEEKEFIRGFLHRFVNSLECLKMKYLFDSDRKMKIDQSDSSFPYSLELRYLLADIELTRERMEELRPREVMLRDLVEWIYAHKEVPAKIQYELSLRNYYQKLENIQKLFFTYTPGSLSQISNAATGNRYTFIYEWGIYESSINVPVLYQLLFETDMQSPAHPSNREWYLQLKSGIEKATNIFTSLEETATAIDQTCTTIYPKELKRFIIGPLHGTYSLDGSPVSEYLKSLGAPEAFALEVLRERIKSNGEKKKKLTSSKTAYQSFEVSRSSQETMVRKVTDYHELLFVPHEIGQKLRSAPATAAEVKRFKFISV